jgi:Mrp family chromosome partitioning ATPase/tetratricopeptide (TPR) repeat protein
MFVVSFYSFKGGVGRTVALLNAAWQLAQRGSTVALLDLDLEAPGLHTAPLRRREEGAWEPAEPRWGFADLVRIDPTREARPAGSPTWPEGFLVQDLGPEGRIGLLAARGTGNGEAGYLRRYEAFVQTFSWSAFYLEADGRGFIEQLLKEIADLDYDYLFVDARTGLTDVAGISLLHIPDLVVLFTNLSSQSLQGIRGQLDCIAEVNQEVLSGASDLRRKDRRSSPIATILAGSPLPSGELRARRQRIKQAETILGRPLDVEIDYLPLLALQEENQILAQQLELHGRDDLLVGAARPFERLADEIVAHNAAAPENLFVEGNELHELGRWREALAHFDEVEQRYGEQRRALLWPARLGKARAQAQGLRAGAARQALVQLVDARPPLAAGEPPRSERLPAKFWEAERPWDERRQLAGGFLATSWSWIILNRFDEAAFDAETALQAVTQPATSQSGRDQKLIRATCGLFLGQALGLAERWRDACRELERAVQLYGELATRPLLEVIALAELAHNRVALCRLHRAAEAVGRAERLLDGREGLSNRESAGRGRRITSTYVRARLRQARAEVGVEQGRGLTALLDFQLAYSEFATGGEEVGTVEVAQAVLALAPFRVGSKAAGRVLEDLLPNARTWSAERLLLPRNSTRVELLLSARGLLDTPPEPASSPLDESEVAPGLGITVSCLIRLEWCRKVLEGGAGSGLGKAADHLAEIRRNRAAWDQYEVRHGLLLLEVLLALALGREPDLGELQGHAEELEKQKMLTRECQARVVLALGAPGRAAAGRDLTRCLSQLEAPAEWLWNLPVALISWAPAFRQGWRRIAPILDGVWPSERLPVTAVHSPAPPAGAAAGRQRNPRT